MKIFKLTAILLLLAGSFSSCEKETDNNINDRYITLYDKTPDKIQTYIQGKWKLLSYEQGVSLTNYKDSDILWTFTDNHLNITNKGVTTTNTAFTWIQQNAVVFGTVYVIAESPHGVSPNYIHNDTLYMIASIGDAIVNGSMYFLKN